MNEEHKERTGAESPARVRRSVIVLSAALVMVVVLSFHIFNKKPAGDTLGALAVDRPYSKSDQLVRRGWTVYREERDLEQAEKFFQEAKRLAPYHQQAVDACGQMALLRGDHECAFKNFHELHKLSNKSRRSYASMSLALLMMGHFHEADKNIVEGIKAHKLENDTQFLLLRSRIQLALKDDKEANDHFKKAVANAGADARLRVLRIVSANKWAADLKKLTAYKALQADREDGKRGL